MRHSGRLPGVTDQIELIRDTGTPVKFVGAKRGAGVWQRIISEMPPHRRFIDAFLGTGEITLRKKPAASTIAIDDDPRAPGFVRCEGVPGLTCVRGDARSVLPKLELGYMDLVYADPPYLGSTRSCHRRYYRCELFTDREHAKLLTLLRSLPCMVMLSGYYSKLYERHLRDWRVLEIPTVDRRGRRRIEMLWCNFPETDQRHDPAHVGTNFRERERIKRKVARWVRMLREMPSHERAAVIAAIGDDRRPASPPQTIRDPHVIPDDAAGPPRHGRREDPVTHLAVTTPGSVTVAGSQGLPVVKHTP